MLLSKRFKSVCAITLSIMMLGSTLWANVLEFNTWAIAPRLNCSAVPVDVLYTTDPAVSYSADIMNEHPNLNVTTNVWTNPTLDADASWVDWWTPKTRDVGGTNQEVWTYAGNKKAASTSFTFTDKKVGQLDITNDGYYYLTSLVLRYYQGTDNNTLVKLYPSNDEVLPDTITDLNVNFDPHPCWDDNVRPGIVLTNFPVDNTTMISTSDMVGNMWDLIDHSTTTGGAEQRWGYFTSTPDLVGGTNYLPNPGNTTASLESSVGIDLDTFSLEFDVNGSVTTLNSGSVGITNNPYDRTWDYLDKNYTGTINTANIPTFPAEEPVVITMSVNDRDGNTHSVTRSFNTGINPWSANTQGTVTEDTTCNINITETQNWYTVDTMNVYLHDDWAGVDPASIQVQFDGSVSDNASFTETLWQADPEITLTQFDYAGEWTRDGMTLPAGKTSTGNYQVTIANDTVFDAEDNVAITINFADNSGKTGNTVTCGTGHEANPIFSDFASNASGAVTTFTGQMNLSNHPQGAQINNFYLQAQDDWAGIDSGTLTYSIAGQELNGTFDDVVVANVTDWFGLTQINGSALWNLWYTVFPYNLLNYELLFDQTTSSFNGSYFAPEYDIVFNATVKDLDSDSGSGKDVSNPFVNVTYSNNEAPKFREGDAADSFDEIAKELTGTFDTTRIFSGATDPKIYPYQGTGITTGSTYTDIAIKVSDNWAWVDSGTVQITIEGKQWGDSYSRTYNIGNDINLSAITESDETWNTLNYLAEVVGHDIYLDWQSYDQSTDTIVDPSSYTITIQASDLKQPTANTTVLSGTADVDNLMCEDLGRCNQSLYFTYRYDTVTPEPVVSTGVHPFVGGTVYVIGSGASVDNTWHIINCIGWNVLGTQIDIAFDGHHYNSETQYDNYDWNTLYVADGLFEMTGSQASWFYLVIK